MTERRRPRKKNTRRSFLISAVVILSIVLLALVGWLILMLQPGPQLTLEAGSPLPQVSDFLPNAGSDAAFTDDISGIDMTVPGQYTLQISDGLMRYTATLTVQDTVAPTATVETATVLVPNTVTPEELVTDIQDVSPVTVAFAQQPDLSQPGDQTVTLVLTDRSGNTTRLETTVTVIKDTQAPVISGVKDILVYAGGTVAYRNGISVTDDYDEAVTFTPDASQVDLSTPGTYKLIYTATDASGNTATQEATVTVLEKQPDHVELDVIYAAVDKVLAKFIRDDMTDRQKAEAIYVWTYKHMNYGGHTDTTDYIQSAYKFLTTRKGDCYGYFALQKLMFERLGIPTIDCRKVKTSPSDSNHYWLMVSIDQGQTYYHFDNVWSYHLCLVTDKYLDDFSARPSVHNAFNRDKSLYPATPTEQLPNVNELPWNDSTILKAYP